MANPKDDQQEKVNAAFDKVFGKPKTTEQPPFKSTRFDYVAYTEESKALQASCKEVFIVLEEIITFKIKPGRAQALALTHLEESYAWIGKAIRDAQVEKLPQEQRSDS